MLEFNDVILGLGSLAGFVSLLVLIYDRWQRHNPKFTVTFDREAYNPEPILRAENPGRYQVILQFDFNDERGRLRVATDRTCKGHLSHYLTRSTNTTPLDPGEHKSFRLSRPDYFDTYGDDATLEVVFRWRFLHRRPYRWRTKRIPFTAGDYRRALNEDG